MRKCAKSLNSEMTNLELDSMIAVLDEMSLKGLHLEIGTAAGGTLCKLLKFYNKHKLYSPKFMVVDLFQYFPDQFGVVCENLIKNGFSPEEIEFLKSDSRSVFLEICTQNHSFDFILIDASHKVKDVMQDLKWARLLNLGGVLCLHDFSLHHRGVYFAATRFLRANPNYKIHSRKGSLLILIKKYESHNREVNFIDEILAHIIHPFFQFEVSLKKRLKRWGFIQH